MTLTEGHRELLRRLTLSDERTLSEVVSGRSPAMETLLDERTRGLVRIAGLVALDGEIESLQAGRDFAWAAGARDEEIVAAVIAIAPIVGAARIASALPRLAIAMDKG